MTRRTYKDGFPLPANVEPETNGFICVPYPNEPAYRQALIGHLYQLGKWWSWEKDGTDRATRAASRWRSALELMSACEGGEGEGMTYPYALLRVKPSNPFVLQQHNGTTWQDAYDYSILATTPQITINTYAELGFTRYETVNNTYNGTLTSVAPNLPYTGDGKNQYRDTALCWMSKVIVDTLCQQEIDRRAQGNTIITAISTAAIGVLIAAAIATTGGTFAVAFAGMAAGSAGAIGASANNLSTLATEALSNKQARLDVACRMADRLKNSALTPAIFADSINLSDHTAGTPAHFIAQAIQPALATTEAYAQFMATANDAINYAELNLIKCECSSTEFWAYEWNFRNSDGGFVRYQNFGQTPSGNYIVGQGWSGGGAGGSNNVLSVRKSGLTIDPTYLEIEVTQTASRSSINDIFGIGDFTGATSPPFNNTVTINNSANVTGTRVLSLTRENGTPRNSVFLYASSTLSTSLIINRFRIGGFGTRPTLSGGTWL